MPGARTIVVGLAIALVAIYLANNVGFVSNIVGKKA